MDLRIRVETAFDTGEKRIHQLNGISRPHRVTCPEGFGLRLEDGKRVVEQIQQAILCDQIEEVTRESRACPACSSVRAIHDYRTRDLDTLFGRFASRLRACALFLRCQWWGDPLRAALFIGPFLSRPRYPGVSAAPCRAWVPALLSRSRTIDEELTALPTASSYHCARPVGSDRR